MSSALNAATTGITNIVSAITGLPGKLLAKVGDFLSAGTALGSNIIDGIGAGFSAIAGFIGDVKTSIGNAFASVVNGLIDTLNAAIPNSLGWGRLSIDIPDDPIPHISFGTGGIVDRPTMGLIGETGHREVIINTERDPDRARQLMADSGLLDLLMSDQPSTRSAGSGSFAGLGVGTTITFGPGSVVITMPPGTSEAEARKLGDAAAEALVDTLAARRVSVAARAQ
jgi:hypothetical protein